MRILTKILLIFLLFIVATPLMVFLRDVAALKFVFLAGLVAGISAIWKYNPEDSSSEIDQHHLDKS